VLDSHGDVVEVRGTELHYQVTGNTVQGMAGTEIIFTVTLDPATGQYSSRWRTRSTIRRRVPIVSICQFGYIVTDGDNDTATGSFTVTVNDDVPTAGPGDATVVSEHNVTPAAFDQSFDAATDAASADSLTAAATACWRSMRRRNPAASSPKSGHGKLRW